MAAAAACPAAGLVAVLPLGDLRFGAGFLATANELGTVISDTMRL